MKYLLQTGLVVTLLVSLVRAETPGFWSRSITVEPISSDDPRGVDLEEVDQRDILFGSLLVVNKSAEVLKSPPSIMVIEGHQSGDGTFWPAAELQVQKEKGGEWIKVGLSGNEQPVSQMKIYSGTTVFGLRINLDPFKAHLGKFRFGRIVIKSGDKADFLLDDLKPPGEKKEK